MSERILVCVAWPYANGSLHLGQIAGAYLPPDIFARYHRAKGNEVVMVSGSDVHGTPTTIKAEQEGKTPQEVAAFYQQEHLGCWQKLGISYDLYTTTGTENHAEVAQDMFLRLLERGYLYKQTVSQAQGAPAGTTPTWGGWVYRIYFRTITLSESDYYQVQEAVERIDGGAGEVPEQ